MISPSYPGVYVEEIPSGVRTIVGVATSITAMLGRALTGPLNRPVRIQSFGEYERVFGGLWVDSPMSYAVRQFFQNGGTDAVIVRLASGAGMATFPGGWLDLQAASEDHDNPGEWGNRLSATVDLDTRNTADASLFNLTLRLHSETGPMTTPDEIAAMNKKVVATESFRNVSTDPISSRYVVEVLAKSSQFVRVVGAPGVAAAIGQAMFTAGSGTPGALLVDADFNGLGFEAAKQGIYALEDTDLFNLLYIPPYAFGTNVGTSVLTASLTYCLEKRRAMFIVDPDPAWATPAAAGAGFDALRATLGGMNSGKNAMCYFPEIRLPDPLQENRLDTFPPGPTLAGIIARTDAQRGVWKAPAGIEAGIGGAMELAYKLTDGENGQLNPLGLNCLRTKVPYGHISWGARTLAGDDRFASEWKYIPVRRTALYIEESLFRGLHWVVFEPNDEPLWASIRMNVKAFMQNLFKKGAFQGTSPKDAFFVQCDRDNNPQSQIDLGIVTVRVGFAPLKPAEFVIIQIQQMAGQLEA
jgi:uncharacterized protein